MERSVSLQRETTVGRRAEARLGWGCGVVVCLTVALASPGRAQQQSPAAPQSSAHATADQQDWAVKDPRFGPEFWMAVRTVAHGVRESPSVEYARRYRISQDLAHDIVEVATAEGIDPELAFRLIHVESRFVRHARGPKGALGLMQLMPGTARSIDPSLRTEAAMLDPKNNMRTGFRYLKSLIERYDGSVRLGLLAYNRGENAVDRALRAGKDPDNGYARRVLTAGPGARYQGKGLLN